MNRSFIKKALLVLIPVSSYYLYSDSLSYYFFQDDWFVLNWVRTSDFFSLFSFRTDIIYWRPLSMPIFFKISRALFALNPVPFHLIVLFFHFINMLLIYLLFKKLKFSKTISFLVSFLYATASFHFIALSWLATASYVIGPCFILTSILLYLNDNKIFSLIFFIFALCSSEFALLIVPFIYLLNTRPKFFEKSLIPFLLLSIVYLLLRIIIFPLPSTGQYSLSFNFKIMENLIWYIVWFFNMPEKMKSILLFNQPLQTITNYINFLRFLILPSITLFLYILIIVIAKPKLKNWVKGLSLFILGLLPVMFITKHTYPLYLTIASIGLFYILGKSLEKLRHQYFIIIVFALVWYFSSIQTIDFTKKSHWLVNQQSVSKAYITELSKLDSVPPDNSLIIFKDANIKFSQVHNITLIETEDNLRQSLNDQDAVQVYFNNSSLNSFYKSSIIKPNSKKEYEIYPKL